MVNITFTVSGGPKDSIYNVLKRQLQREPTNAEIKSEVQRILSGM